MCVIIIYAIECTALFHVINTTNHGYFEIWNSFVVLNKISHSFVLLTREISWSTLKINFIFPDIHLLFFIYLIWSRYPSNCLQQKCLQAMFLLTFGDLVRAYNLNASLFWAITLETWAIFVLASAFSISATLTRLTAGTLRTFSCCFLEKLRKWAFKWGKITSICSTQFTSSDGWLNPGSSGGATGGVGGRVGGGGISYT